MFQTRDFPTTWSRAWGRRGRLSPSETHPILLEAQIELCLQTASVSRCDWKLAEFPLQHPRPPGTVEGPLALAQRLTGPSSISTLSAGSTATWPLISAWNSPSTLVGGTRFVFNPDVTGLRRFLTTLYPSSRDARRVAGDAGLNESRIDFAGNADVVWDSILKEAKNTRRVKLLVDVVAGDFPDHRVRLASLARALRDPPAHRRKTISSSSPASQPPGVVIVRGSKIRPALSRRPTAIATRSIVRDTKGGIAATPDIAVTRAELPDLSGLLADAQKPLSGVILVLDGGTEAGEGYDPIADLAELRRVLKERWKQAPVETRVVLVTSPHDTALRAKIADLCHSLPRAQVVHVVARDNDRDAVRRYELELERCVAAVAQDGSPTANKPRLFGRNKALTQIWHWVVDGRSRPLLLEGPGGAGKSALAEATADALLLADSRPVVHVKFYPEDAKRPDYATGTLVTAVMEGIYGGVQAAWEDWKKQEPSTRWEAAIFLRRLGIDVPVVSSDAASVVVENVVKRGRAAVIVCLDRARCAIIIDDIQWIDQTSRAFFEELLRRKSPRYRVVLTKRTDDDSAVGEAAENNAWPTVAADRVEVKELPEKACKQLIERLAPRKTDRDKARTFLDALDAAERHLPAMCELAVFAARSTETDAEAFAKGVKSGSPPGVSQKRTSAQPWKLLKACIQENDLKTMAMCGLVRGWFDASLLVRSDESLRDVWKEEDIPGWKDLLGEFDGVHGVLDSLESAEDLLERWRERGLIFRRRADGAPEYRVRHDLFRSALNFYSAHDPTTMAEVSRVTTVFCLARAGRMAGAGQRDPRLAALAALDAYDVLWKLDRDGYEHKAEFSKHIGAHVSMFQVLDWAARRGLAVTTEKLTSAVRDVPGGFRHHDDAWYWVRCYTFWAKNEVRSEATEDGKPKPALVDPTHVELILNELDRMFESPHRRNVPDIVKEECRVELLQTAAYVANRRDRYTDGLRHARAGLQILERHRRSGQGAEHDPRGIASGALALPESHRARLDRARERLLLELGFIHSKTGDLMTWPGLRPDGRPSQPVGILGSGTRDDAAVYSPPEHDIARDVADHEVTVAIEALDRAWKIAYEKAGQSGRKNNEDIASVNNHRGWILWRSGFRREAQHSHQDSLRRAALVDDVRRQAWARIGIGHTWIDCLGRTAAGRLARAILKAREHHDEHQRRSGGEPEVIVMFNVFYLSGCLYLRYAAQYKEACTWFEMASDYLQARGVRFEALYATYRLYETRLEQALWDSQKVVLAGEVLADITAKLGSLEEDVDLRQVKREIAILRRLRARAMRLAGKPDEAVAEAECARRVLREVVGDRYEWCLATMELARAVRDTRGQLRLELIIDLRQAALFLATQGWTRALDDLSHEFVHDFRDAILDDALEGFRVMGPIRSHRREENRVAESALIKQWNRSMPEVCNNQIGGLRSLSEALPRAVLRPVHWRGPV